MHLITQADIEAITGITDDLSELIDYSQAQAEALIGFLEEEEVTKDIYMFEESTIINIEDYPINSVESITYKATANSTERTFATTKYRAMLSEGLIIFDELIPEGYMVYLTHTRGWNQTTVTPLVKLLLVVLVIEQYYALYPSRGLQSHTVLSEKIGDYAIKYANLKPSNRQSWEDWIDYLVMLIRKQGNAPEVR